MQRIVVLSALAFVLLAAGTVAAQQPAAAVQPAQSPAYITVYAPPDATLLIDGARTQQTGETRRFVSPPLPAGRRFVYSIKATWRDQGKELSKEEVAHVQAGTTVNVDLRPAPAIAQQDQKKSKSLDREPDVIFVPTPQAVVDKMLELAEVKKGDVVYDLGCGDGRIVVTAAKKFGVKGVGYDIDPQRIKESLENVKKNGVENLVTIKRADIFEQDLTPASVVTLYLLPELNVKLMPQLAKLKPGSRIVSHDFDMRGAKPEKTIQINATDENGNEREHTIYLWRVPWKEE